MTFLRNLAANAAVRVLALSALLAAAPLAAVRYSAAVLDPDIWWHLRTGDTILQTGSFPHTGVFSWVASSNPWIAYSWLFELLASRVFHALGLAGLPTLHFILQIALATALFGCLHAVSGSFWRAFTLSAVGVAAFFYTMTLRPMILSELFFVIELALIFSALRRRAIRPLFWLLPLFILWANCHIQFVDGLAVLVLFAVSLSAQEMLYRRGWFSEASPLPAARVWLILAACALATLIGPYGARIYQVVWLYATQPAQWQQYIELAAPNFRRPAHYVELLLAISAGFLLGRRSLRTLFAPALLVATAALSFHAMRDAWLLGIAALFICAEALRASGEQPVEPRARGASLVLAGGAVLALLLSLGAQSRSGFSTEVLARRIDVAYPVRAAEFLRRSHLPGPLYNPVNWGGFLIFNLREYPVSFDDRSDAYGGSLHAYERSARGGLEWRVDPVLQRSNIILIELDSPLVPLLISDPSFQPVYRDHLAVIFVRKAAVGDKR